MLRPWRLRRRERRLWRLGRKKLRRRRKHREQGSYVATLLEGVETINTFMQSRKHGAVKKQSFGALKCPRLCTIVA